jgi:long-chain fatty acid transport protein
MKLKAIARASILPLVMLPGMALATTGYFSHGYGVKAQGMAGVGIALPQDGLAAATNPAGTAFVGDRLDVGLVWFRPSRGGEIEGNNAMTPMGPTSLDGKYDANESQNFFIPEIGYVRQMSPQLALGVAIYGNGGMNTDYKESPFKNFGATGSGGVNLEQLFVAPSIAWKVNENHSLGASLTFAYQRFRIEGIQPFAAFGASSDPSNFTNNKDDSSTGWGVRLGYTGKITPTVTVGATWASKTYMSEFDKYSGLFAEQGDFDIPSNFGIGVAWQATPSLVLAADVSRILYSGVDSIGNPIQNLTVDGNLFGTDKGPGFGWDDVTVFKLGTAYTMGDWTLRGGYAYVTQPISKDQTFLNLYAPGVVQHHLTLGATWAVSKTGELSMSYMHSFENTVKGSGSIPANFGGGETNIHMYQDSFGIAYGWKF